MATDAGTGPDADASTGGPTDAGPGTDAGALDGSTPLPDGSMRPPAVDLDALGYFDVTDYGADNTGATVSTEAIQRAIDASLEEERALFFPSGTYLVDDTLRCMQAARAPADSGHGVDHGCTLIGSTRGARPIIRLADDSPGFDDPSVTRATISGGTVTGRPTIKPIVHFWRQQELSAGGSTDPELENGGRNYNQVIRNIDFDLGTGNSGAVAIRHAGAEGSAIQQVRVNARDGFAGLYAFPSSGGLTTNVEVVGGRHGIHAPKLRGGAAVLTGLRLSGQADEPIVHTHIYPLTIVGFEIEHDGGPIVSRRRHASQSSGHLALVDGTITLTGTGAGVAVQNTDRSIYMRDVYVRGAATIVRNTMGGPSLTAASASGWSHVQEYAHVTGGAFIGAVRNGATMDEDIQSVRTVAAPPRGLVEAHVYPEDLCTFEAGDAANVMDFGAVGDGSTDDTAAIRAAIAAEDRVIVPKGRYVVSDTIDLRSSTQLCGVTGVLSVIMAASGWTEAGFTPLVRTPDDPDARVVLDSLQIRTRQTANRIHNLHWRSGSDSIVRNVIPATRGPWPGSFDVPLVRTRITGNGGGRFFGYPQARSWDCMDERCRIMLIEGTTQPLAFYMYHHQYLKVGGGPLTELRNARNVSFFGQKTETIIPGRESMHASRFGTPWPILMGIHDSRDIAVISEEGPSQCEPGRGLFEITDSRNIRLIHIARRGNGTNALHNPTTWYFVKEVHDGDVSTIDATGVVGVFRRD